MGTVDLIIEGMSCEHCVARVKKALEGVDGVVEADVTIDPGSATVRGEGYRMEDLVEAVDRVGYTARAA
jgi:copper chaperone CopZ